MNRTIKRLWNATAIGVACSLCPVSAATVPQTPASGLSALIGTFNCVTLESDKTAWRFHSVNVSWGGWVRADTVSPAQHGQPMDRHSTFVGYDASSRRWNIVALDMSDGSYYTRYSHSADLNGSHWLDGYPADNAEAVIRTYGGSRYTFSFSQPAQKGQAADSSVTTCTRV